MNTLLADTAMDDEEGGNMKAYLKQQVHGSSPMQGHIQPSPTQKPKTPQVGDLALTDSELNMIAKYFDQEAQSGVSLQAQAPQGQVGCTGLQYLGQADVGNTNMDMGTPVRTPMGISVGGGGVRGTGESCGEPGINMHLGSPAKEALRPPRTSTRTAYESSTYSPHPAPKALKVQVSTPTPRTPSNAFNEMFGGGGVDNLLNWTEALDASDI